MLQAFIMKRIASAFIKKVMANRAIRKMQKYVEEDNELDIQMKQVQKTLSKHGRTLEGAEKDIAQLRVSSHPPVLMKDDYKDIMQRLEKLEKKES